MLKKMARKFRSSRVFLFCRLENENVPLFHPREKRAEKALSSWASHRCLTEWNRRKAARNAGDAAFLKMAVPPKRFFAARKRFCVNDTKKRPRAITSPRSTSAPAPRPPASKFHGCPRPRRPRRSMAFGFYPSVLAGGVVLPWIVAPTCSCCPMGFRHRAMEDRVA